jgi:hypothetical protein
MPWEITKLKTVSVRIKAEQAKRLQEMAHHIPGFSVDGAVKRAVDLWLEVEGPVYEEAFKEARRKLQEKRQVVVINQHV